MVDAFEKSLTDSQWIGGQLPTGADREAYETLKTSPPNVTTHPHTFAWWILVSKFAEPVRAAWTGAAAAPAKKAAKVAEKKVEAKKEAAEEDEFDPFADDDEDDIGDRLAAKAAKDEVLAAAIAAKKAKEALVIARSLVILEVKPWGEDTDLNELAKLILAIEQDGLQWKTEWKKEPVAYGVFKILIGCIIEDVKVSTDDLIEKIEGFEDYVQSVDIAAFNKL